MGNNLEKHQAMLMSMIDSYGIACGNESWTARAIKDEEER